MLVPTNTTIYSTVMLNVQARYRIIRTSGLSIQRDSITCHLAFQGRLYQVLEVLVHTKVGSNPLKFDQLSSEGTLS